MQILPDTPVTVQASKTLAQSRSQLSNVQKSLTNKLTGAVACFSELGGRRFESKTGHAPPHFSTVPLRECGTMIASCTIVATTPTTGIF